jgi:hypothetical protein
MLRLVIPTHRCITFVVAAPLLCVAAITHSSPAANCRNTSVSLVPVNDLGPALYLNQFQGGLYPNGLNIMPIAHAQEGLARAQAVQPRSPQGQPHPNGKYVLLSVGMSNTTQEYSRFIQLANNSAAVDHVNLVIVDGAAGGQTSSTWDSPTDANYDRVRDMKLAPLGLTESQVQVAWVKSANAGPNSSLPNANADAYALKGQLADIVRAMTVRYPNVQMVFFSSRIYAGYASTQLNPEPYAYESAFGVKWVIEAQIDQIAGNGIDPQTGDLDYNTIAPWLAWGPYTWADGLSPRSDGLVWQCSDLSEDGTHPSPAGRDKVANMLMNFLLNSPAAAPWFRVPVIGDVNDDSLVNINDLLLIINHWGQCTNPPHAPGGCPSDLTGNGVTNIDDLLAVINNWS